MRPLSRFQKALVGIGSSVVGGAAVVLTGIFDPSWLLSNSEIWWGIGSMITRFIGPNLVEGVPWSTLTLLLAGVSIAAMLYRLDKKRRVDS